MLEDRAWLARVLNVGEGVVGAAFVIDDFHLLTCAHVVEDAGAQGPGDRVSLDFPLLAACCEAEVLVENWRPASGSSGDVALLRVEHLPGDAEAVPLQLADSLAGVPFTAYGFPEGYNDSVSTEGNLGHAAGLERVQLEVTSELAVSRGFSGAAVWDVDEELVVALMVTRDLATEGRVAFAIPVGVLAHHSPIVRARLPGARPGQAAHRAGWRQGLDEKTVLRGHMMSVSRVAFAPDAAHLASAGGDLRFWDAASGKLIRTLGQRRLSWATAVAFSPDGSLLACAGEEGSIRLFDVASGGDLGELGAHPHEGVHDVCFSPDGSTLASAGWDGTVRLWHVDRRVELRCVCTEPEKVDEPGGMPDVRKVTFSPDGKQLAGAVVDGTVRLWHVVTGEELCVLHGHDESVYGAAFSPDGLRLASASDDTTVRLWDPATGGAEDILDGHSEAVAAVAFAPDGSILASAGGQASIRLIDRPAGKDCAIHLWDPESREELQVREGHTDAVSDLAFSPDGAVLASSSRDSTVRLWTTAK